MFFYEIKSSFKIVFLTKFSTRVTPNLLGSAQLWPACLKWMLLFFVLSETLRFHRRVASRQFSMQRMNDIQKNIEGWEGRDISQVCNEFIMEGNLGKVHAGKNKKVGLGAGTLLPSRNLFLYLQFEKFLRLNFFHNNCPLKVIP